MDLLSTVEDLKENGYVKINEFMSFDECILLEKKAIKAFKKAKEDLYHTNNDYVKVLSISEKNANEYRYLKFLTKFFTDENLKSFVKSYFMTDDIEISKIFLAESSNNGEIVDKLPYKMHFDKTRYLKLMVYLRDVNSEDGGITFAKKEWNTKLQEELLNKQALQEENVVEVNDPEAIDEIKGQRGTAVFFDTNITHKAGQVTSENKRLVLRIDTRIKIN